MTYKEYSEMAEKDPIGFRRMLLRLYIEVLRENHPELKEEENEDDWMDWMSGLA